MAEAAVAAGWYQDPHDPSRLRWFDGNQWTDNYHPPATTVHSISPVQMAQAPQSQFPAPSASMRQPDIAPPSTSSQTSDTSDQDVARKSVKTGFICAGVGLLLLPYILGGAAIGAGINALRNADKGSRTQYLSFAVIALGIVDIVGAVWMRSQSL